MRKILDSSGLDLQPKTVRVLAKTAASFALLFGRSVVTYGGDGTRAADAWKVFRKYRRGDPLFEGPYVRQLEDRLSHFHGGREVITFGAGRMALYAILKAMGLRPGDEVILPGYTCIVTPSAIRFAGQRPVYVDVSLQDFNMTPEGVEKAITSRTKAILAQHTFGIPCDMEALLDISAHTGIPIIEDGAHAIGGRWKGELLGNLGYAGFFSTQATKMLRTNSAVDGASIHCYSPT